MTNIKDKLKAARRPEKIVPVCLRGDLAAEFEQVRRELAELAEPGPDASLNAGAGRRELLERMEHIRDEMAASVVEFRIRALPPARWDELAIKFPPREGVAADKAINVNEAEFIPAVLREGVCEPEMDEEDWANLDQAVSRGQLLELANAAWEVNQQRVNVPFLPAALLNHRSSESG